MPKVFEGKLQGEGLKIGILVSKFNEAITEKLLEGALEALRMCNVKEEDIEIFKIPGAFEFTFFLKKLAKSKKYDAIICLGCVIRGETAHFEYVASESAKAVGKVNFEYDTPCTFGVLTCNDTQEALERAGIKKGNKGFEAALSAIELANLMKKTQL